MDLIQPFFDAKSRRLQELVDLRRQGRKVIGFFCLHTPPALIEMAGGIPLRLCLPGNAAVQRGGELHARNCICPFVKACLGNLAAGNPWFAAVDAIAAGSACDQMRHLADVLRSRFHLPAYVFFQPRGLENKEAIWLYMRELQWLFRELSMFCGVDMSEQERVEVVRRYNGILHYLSALQALRAGDNPAVSGLEWMTVVQTGFLVNSGTFLGLLEELIRRLPGRHPQRKAALRIMLVGGMHVQDDNRILRAIEDSGKAVVVADTLCTGARVIGQKIAIEGDALQNLTAAHCMKTPCIHARPNTAVYAYVARQAAQHKVDGAVLHALKFCDGWGGEWLRMQRFLQQLGIPSVVLDTDYGTADTGQIATRIDAFLEMLIDKQYDVGKKNI